MSKNFVFKKSRFEVPSMDYKDVSLKYWNLSLVTVAVLAVVTMVSPDLAMANDIGEMSGFKNALDKIINVIAGPIGQAISVGGMAIAGIVFIFNRQDMGEGFKSLLAVVFGICFIAFGASIVNAIFSGNSALIA